jgi:predicted DsbA family dithiol-disulfide isomerase
LRTQPNEPAAGPIPASRLGSLPVELTLFTDPACPFAFSAEPIRWRLRWSYGDQLAWRTRMIVLTREPGEAEKLAAGAPNLQRRYGMPIDPAPYPRASSSEQACLAFVATRDNAPAHADRLLRRLRIRRMDGGLIDDPELISAAAADAGLDPAELARWSAGPESAAALEVDAAAARSPSPAARLLDDKLGGPPGERRYTAPSYELVHAGAAAAVPGFNPFDAYEVALASVAPELARRPPPDSVEELLAWAGEPLATAEIVAVLGQDEALVRTALGRVARATPSGADWFWQLP